jgi:hypothetical protein
MWLTDSMLGDLILVAAVLIGYSAWRRGQVYYRIWQKLHFAKLLRLGLEEYRGAHGTYPTSPTFRPLRGSTPADVAAWLPLSDEIVGKLPLTILHRANGGGTWMYRSDGERFKLICHHPPEDEARMAVRNFAQFVDPERSTPEEAHAYGVWSRGAEAW